MVIYLPFILFKVFAPLSSSTSTIVRLIAPCSYDVSFTPSISFASPRESSCASTAISVLIPIIQTPFLGILFVGWDIFMYLKQIHS